MTEKPTKDDREAASTAPARLPRFAGAPAFLACLTMLLLAAILLERVVRARDVARFERAVAAVEHRILSRFDTTATLLRGGAGLFAATAGDAVDAQSFRRFVDRTRLAEKHPEILGLGFSLVVSPERAATLPEELERQGLPRIELHPAGDGERHAIVFLEPLDGRNLEALGLDMHREPVRREAMDRARDGGRIAASGRVTLVQETDITKQPGFLLYVPVYRGGGFPDAVEARRASHNGFVYSPIRAHDFFNTLFAADDLLVDFAVYDGARPAEDALLFGSPAPSGAIEADRQLEVAGRTWTIHYATNHRFEQASSRGDLMALGLAGLVASVLVLFLVRRQAAARYAEAAARLAEEKRRKQAEALAAELVTLSQDVMREVARRRAEREP